MRDLGKWIFDRSVAFIGLLFLSPLIGLTALAIRIKMPDGPVFFRQIRIGQYGKPFTLIKFRTMKQDHSDASTITTANDKRVTPLGDFLRRHKIDEIPELWNVLIADMSFVGPRPDVPGYADCLRGNDKVILDLKPGITGPATLKYRNEEELLAQHSDPHKFNDDVLWPDKVSINRRYALEHSFRGDIKIIMQTLFGSRSTISATKTNFHTTLGETGTILDSNFKYTEEKK